MSYSPSPARMSIFDAYDAEFSSLRDEISKNISELRSNVSDIESSGNSVRLIDALFAQCNDLVKQMEMEVRSSDSSTRKKLSEKMNGYKKSISAAKVDFERLKSDAEKDLLMTGTSGEQRKRLLDTTDKIHQQNFMIEQAHRTVAETEEVGMEITAELARNREKIESSRTKAGEFSSITDSARRLLGSMNRRDSRQRMIVGGVVAFLVLVIVLSIYFSVR